jgi:hypothetical protein
MLKANQNNVDWRTLNKSNWSQRENEWSTSKRLRPRLIKRSLTYYSASNYSTVHYIECKGNRAILQTLQIQTWAKAVHATLAKHGLEIELKVYYDTDSTAIDYANIESTISSSLHRIHLHSYLLSHQFNVDEAYYTANLLSLHRSHRSRHRNPTVLGSTCSSRRNTPKNPLV